MARLATGTEREAVPARSAFQCIDAAELIWTSICVRGRCEPGRPRGPVAVPCAPLKDRCSPALAVYVTSCTVKYLVQMYGITLA